MPGKQSIRSRSESDLIQRKWQQSDQWRYSICKKFTVTGERARDGLEFVWMVLRESTDRDRQKEENLPI